MFKKKTAFEVIGGKNLFNKASANMYLMTDQSKKRGEGVVEIQKKLYYFLGVDRQVAHKRSAGKAAVGAIVGGVLTGGIGAVAGAAIGGRRKDDSTYTLDFADFETKQEFSVQVRKLKNVTDFAEFRVATID